MNNGRNDEGKVRGCWRTRWWCSCRIQRRSETSTTFTRYRRDRTRTAIVPYRNTAHIKKGCAATRHLPPSIGSSRRKKLLSNFFAAVLLFSAVANLALHRRFFDILNVIFMSFTIAAIRYDSLVSRMFITMHAVLSIMGMAYFAVRLYWGQVAYLLGCIILCTFVLFWRDEAVISLL